jgi:hypothetical protein
MISNKTLKNSINYMDDLGGYHSERVYVAGKGLAGFNYDFKIVEGGRVLYRKNEEIIRNGSLGTIVKINLDPERKVETIDIKFDRVDEDGWPHWTELKALKNLDDAKQGLLMKEAIIKYF